MALVDTVNTLKSLGISETLLETWLSRSYKAYLKRKNGLRGGNSKLRSANDWLKNQTGREKRLLLATLTARLGGKKK